MRPDKDIIDDENLEFQIRAYKDCAEVLVLIYEGIKSGKMLNPVIRIKDDPRNSDEFKSVSLAHLIAEKLKALEEVLQGEKLN